MGEFCLVASHGLLFPEQPISRDTKEHVLSNLRPRPDILKFSALYHGSCLGEEAWKPMYRQPEGVPFVDIDMAIRRHIRNGAKDAHLNSVLLSLGIGRQIIKHENIVKFLTSDSSVIEIDGMDISTLSDLMGLQPLTSDMHQEPLLLGHQSYFSDVESQPSLSYRSKELHFQMPLFEMGKNMSDQVEFTSEDADGQQPFYGAGTTMQDVLKIITEFNSARSSTQWEKHSLIVPYFERKKSRAAKVDNPMSSLSLETLAPMKSPGKPKAKQPPRRKSSGRPDREKDMYTKNSVHACESLLSIMINKGEHGKTAIQSVKNSGPEIPQLLTQISATIAGTGIAVLFSVICKVACSSAPFCASKILSTSLGLGLVWLSWAVNRLRDTIIHISKRSTKVVQKEEDMVKVLDNSVNEIYFRAATLLGLIVLRTA